MFAASPHRRRGVSLPLGMKIPLEADTVKGDQFSGIGVENGAPKLLNRGGSGGGKKVHLGLSGVRKPSSNWNHHKKFKLKDYTPDLSRPDAFSFGEI